MTKKTMTRKRAQNDPKMGGRLIFILGLALCVFSITPSWNLAPVRAQAPISISLDPIVNGLNQPVYVTHAGDGSGRLFVVEQGGTIRIVVDGALLPVPFLDIRSKVTAGGERGLLSVAFHPDFKNNGRFFVDYTANRPNLKTVIAEYAVSSNPDIAQTVETVLLTIDQPFDNHNGGQLQFGPDGYLYIGMGDGGSGGDPQGNGQNLNVLLGKILRIEVKGNQPYGIPPENPFVNLDGRDEIFALGLRNPWRFSFDRLTGRLFAGDVGQNTREEIDLIERGENYGWNRYEASLCFNPPSGCEADASLFHFPIAEYGRSEGASTTGGYVYRGILFPELRGTYLFGDFISGEIWSLQETPFGTWNRTALLNTGFNISSFGEDEAGELYVVNYAGSVLRLRLNNPRPAREFSSLIPSSAKTDRFTSSLVLLNQGSQSIQFKLSSHGPDGELRASQTFGLNPAESLRTDDVLALLGLPNGNFGPLTLEPLDGLPLSAISEVRSSKGTGGFFRTRQKLEGSTDLIIPEVIDNGERGTVGTFRTNLGLNNTGTEAANVLVALTDDHGVLRNSRSWAVPPNGMTQIDGIVKTMTSESEAPQFRGYIKLSSDQPIQAWASKIENGTDDPSFETALGPFPSDRGPHFLIPSIVNTDRFVSTLVIINTRVDRSANVHLNFWSLTGESLNSKIINLGPAQAYFSENIIADSNASSGSFGPLTIESEESDQAALVVASEVRSATGTGGFFPGQLPSLAYVRCSIPEIVDTGNRGSEETYRTNLGLNNPGTETANVSLELIDSTGMSHGQMNVAVPHKGLAQINDIARIIIGNTNPTGFRGYLKIHASTPIFAWASKINNETDDPSIIVGIP